MRKILWQIWGNRYVRNTSVFCLFFLAFSFVIFSVAPVSSGDDHFFHFRFAEIMRGKGLLQSFYDFKAIYFSKMAQGAQYFVYYNFLFYLAIIPLTFLSPLFLAIKLYAVIASALAFTALYFCLDGLQIKRAFLWTLISFCIAEPVLLFRFFTSRPFTLAPAILILLIYALHKKKYLATFILSFVYLFWHSSTFFFVPFVVFTYFVFEKFYGQKGDYKNLLYGFGGSIASLITVYLIAPNFFTFIYDTVIGIFRDTIVGKSVPIPEGAELYPADFFVFLQSSLLLTCSLMILGSVFVYRYVNQKIKWREADVILNKNQVLYGALFFLSIIFFLGTVAASRRFEDFFTFFSIFFIAVYSQEVIGFVDFSDKTIKKSLMSGIVVCVMYLFASNLLSLQNLSASGVLPDNFERIGGWLNSNLKPGDIVFNANWSWFPQLYYNSPELYYVSGLEPRFLYEYNPSLYWEWYHMVSSGYDCDTQDCAKLDSIRARVIHSTKLKAEWYKSEGELIADTIQKDFKTKYIVSSKDLSNMNDILDGSKRFTKVFSDRDALFIYKIN